MKDDRILIKALDELKALIEVFSESVVIIDKAKENYDASEVLTVQGVIDWMNEWDQLRGTSIPMRFKEDFKNKL